MDNSQIKLCDYGCGIEAKFQFKNGKNCCQKYSSKCPEQRKINSNKNKGIKNKNFIFVEFENPLKVLCNYGCGQEAKYLIGKSLTPCCKKNRISCKANLAIANDIHKKKGYKKGKENKLFGVKRKDQSEFMKKNNPMFDDEIKNKVILITTSDEYKEKMSKIIIKVYEENPEIKIKQSKKAIDLWKKTEFRVKILKIWEDLGIRTPDNLLSEKALYYREVEYYTNVSLRKYIDKINPENKKIGKNNGEYSTDHKYSKIMGFKNNIDPRIIGSWPNLRTILFSENASKKRKCTITKEELYKLYEELCNEDNI